MQEPRRMRLCASVFILRRTASELEHFLRSRDDLLFYAIIRNLRHSEQEMAVAQEAVLESDDEILRSKLTSVQDVPMILPNFLNHPLLRRIIHKWCKRKQGAYKSFIWITRLSNPQKTRFFMRFRLVTNKQTMI